MQTGAAESAIVYLEQVLSVGRGINHRYFESESLLALGAANEKLGKRNLSVEILQAAQSLSEEHNFEEINFRAHLALSEIYQKENQLQTALRHHQAYHRIWQKIYNAASWSRIQRLFFRQEASADAPESDDAAGDSRRANFRKSSRLSITISNIF